MASTAHGTLTAGQVARVTIDTGFRGFEVVNRDQAGPIWVRLDGQDPVPEQPGTFVVLGARHFSSWRGQTTLALVADAARAYSVEAT